MYRLGMVTTIAGNGRQNFIDGLNASFDYAYGIWDVPNVGLLVADTGNLRIRRVLPGKRCNGSACHCVLSCVVLMGRCLLHVI